jgi:hypothetical protein
VGRLDVPVLDVVIDPAKPRPVITGKAGRPLFILEMVDLVLKTKGDMASAGASNIRIDIEDVDPRRLEGSSLKWPESKDKDDGHLRK